MYVQYCTYIHTPEEMELLGRGGIWYYLLFQGHVHTGNLLLFLSSGDFGWTARTEYAHCC